jgi:predicted nucleic acid-binding protein
MRAVIDTNIWVSSLLNPFGFPAIVRKSDDDIKFDRAVSTFLLQFDVSVISLAKFLSIIKP